MPSIVTQAATALALVATVAGVGWASRPRAPATGPTRGAVRAAPPPRPPAPAPVPRLDPAGTTIGTRFPPPDGFARTPGAAGSYAARLRALPLLPDGTPVRLYTGAWKARQDVHAAVLDLDVGSRDLQQCADAAIRLRAEYLFSVGRLDDISFHFTSGFPCAFSEWRRGRRVAVTGNHVEWTGGAAPDASPTALRAYLDMVFTYAGTASLPRDVDPVGDVSRPEPGDVYLRPGSPGHAMTVVDVVVRDGARAILLAQGYMPAQQVHVVRNPASPVGDAWFPVADGPRLVTPEWTFAWSDLRRFRGVR